MLRHLPRTRCAALLPCLLTLLAFGLLVWPLPARATFHLIEINKIMAAYNGDATIQAVELKVLRVGQNLVSFVQINTYDAGGQFVANLGEFTAPIANGSAGAQILCATPKFASTFGITPDMVIAPGIPVTTGQVAFEQDPGGDLPCRVNAIPYGAVTNPIGGPTFAPPLPAGGATALVRVVDDLAAISCPLVENANLNFRLSSGSSVNPITFTNNSGASVNVFSTVTAVEETTPAVNAVHVYPNPIRGSARIEAPAWEPLTIHDLQGRLVRIVTCWNACPRVAGPFRGEWDGRDQHGARVPSGVYFLRYRSHSEEINQRIVLIR